MVGWSDGRMDRWSDDCRDRVVRRGFGDREMARNRVCISEFVLVSERAREKNDVLKYSKLHKFHH